MEEKEMNFEEAMQELETITRELEKGMEVSKKCNEILENAEKRITILLKQENEEYKEENFVPEDK